MAAERVGRQSGRPVPVDGVHLDQAVVHPDRLLVEVVAAHLGRVGDDVLPDRRADHALVRVKELRSGSRAAS